MNMARTVLSRFSHDDTSAMTAMKQRLRCKPFKHFVEDVCASGFRWDLIAAGAITDVESGFCLDAFDFNDDLVRVCVRMRVCR